MNLTTKEAETNFTKADHFVSPIYQELKAIVRQFISKKKMRKHFDAVSFPFLTMLLWEVSR